MENSIGRYLSANDITQEDFARSAKVSQATVHDWVRGKKKPDTWRIPALAKIIGTTPQSLLVEFHLNNGK